MPLDFAEDLNGILNMIVFLVIHYFLLSFFWQFLLENVIAGLNFHPSGEVVATLTDDGKCLISDINSNKCNFGLCLEKRKELWGK